MDNQILIDVDKITIRRARQWDTEEYWFEVENVWYKLDTNPIEVLYEDDVNVYDGSLPWVEPETGNLDDDEIQALHGTNVKS